MGLKIQKYEYEVCYLKGEHNVADSLSKAPISVHNQDYYMGNVYFDLRQLNFKYELDS